LHPYVLTDLRAEPPGAARLRHGLGLRSPIAFARRVAEVGAEVAWAALMDRLRPLRGAVRRMEPGDTPTGGRRLALYTHWSPDGRVSAMVLGQIEAWRAAGFDIVFVSNAAPPPADWEAVGAHCVLRIARDNIGRDFGAWRDALPLAVERFGPPDELLLANDSVIGPLHDFGPVIAALRAGDGLFGMTESRGGGAHLQSYALLARGEAAVGQVACHLAGMTPGRSKWRLVRDGEIGLTRRVLAQGLRVGALFGQDRVTARLDAAARARLGPRYAEPEGFERYPLNPTHHLWRELVEAFGLPFLKTELVLRNPLGLPGVERWREVVPPALLPRAEAHLALMRGG
jgi:hypothetical protein